MYVNNVPKGSIFRVPVVSMSFDSVLRKNRNLISVRTAVGVAMSQLMTVVFYVYAHISTDSSRVVSARQSSTVI